MGFFDKTLRDGLGGIYELKTFLSIYERKLALEQFSRAATKLKGTVIQIEKSTNK